MPNTLNLKPKSGDYYTGNDVTPQILPTSENQKNADDRVGFPNQPIPRKKTVDDLWQKQMERIAAGNGSALGSPSVSKTGSKASLHPSVQPIQKKQEPPPPSVSAPDTPSEDGGRHLPPYLRYLLSPNLKRATGNPAWVWTVKVTTEKSGKVASKFEEFHLIVCWYQFMIGALGGIAVGLETSFFAAARLSQPNIPIPEKMGLLRTATNFLVQKSSSFYRLSKRALISGYLFDVIDKNVEEYREKQDWKNMGISGGITGTIFGLRGGFRGGVAGSMLFAGFGSLAGYQFYRIKQGKTKPGS